MDVTFNIAKGYEKRYEELVGTGNAAFIVVLLKVVEADDTLIDRDTLAAVLSGGSTEANFTNYGRKTVTSATPTVDDTNDWYYATFADPVWSSAGGATDNDLVALLVCYDPDTTTGTDSTIVPITKHDFIISTNGTSLTAHLGATGFVVVQ